MKSRSFTLRIMLGWRASSCLMLVAMAGVGLCADSVVAGGINRTIVTRILHTGDPAPGIEGATVVWVGKPQIDAGGAVSFEGFIAGDGVDGSNNLVLWYGPPGGLAVVAREGDQVPGLPFGVIYDDWEVTYTMGEDGTLSIGAILMGPSVIPGVNDKALLVGPAGDLQLMIRAGDQAPGMPPDVVISPSGIFFARLTDDGRFMAPFILSGLGIDTTNDVAFWAVDATGWHLLVRTGDPAPGTEPGVTFKWIDGARFNPNLEIAFRAGLTGATVTNENDMGYWSGSPGDVQLVARAGNPAPGLGPDVVFLFAGSLPSLAGTGDVGFGTTVSGEGIDSQNDQGIWVGPPGDVQLVAREGDPIPGLPGSIRYDFVTTLMINAEQRALFAAGFVDDAGTPLGRAVMLGSFDSPRIVLREGSPVPGLEPGVVFDNRLFNIASTNDIGDVVEAAGVAGLGVEEDNEIVFLLRDHRTGAWYPLFREGDVMDGYVFAMDVIQDAASVFWKSTGGSDGLRQSINDQARFAGNLAFDDGSLGNYLFELPVMGDFDANGFLDLLDYEAFLGCVTGAAAKELPPNCDAFDIDWDGDIDYADFGLFQILFDYGQ